MYSIVGVASRNRIRSISFSACFISSIDCFLMKSPSAVITPVVAHLCVQEVLIDGRELFLESQVELCNDLSVTAHEPPPSRRANDSHARRHRTLNNARGPNSWVFCDCDSLSQRRHAGAVQSIHEIEPATDCEADYDEAIRDWRWLNSCRRSPCAGSGADSATVRGGTIPAGRGLDKPRIHHPKCCTRPRRASRRWAPTIRRRRPSAGWPNVPRATRGTSSVSRAVSSSKETPKRPSHRLDRPWRWRLTFRPPIFSLALRSPDCSSGRKPQPRSTRQASVSRRNAYAHYYGGMMHYRANRVDRMAVHFEQFLKLAPEAPERPEVLSIMRTLQSR